MVVKKVKLVSSLLGSGIQKIRGAGRDNPQADMSLLDHMFELRKHFVRIVRWFALFTILAMAFWDHIFRFLKLPFEEYMRAKGRPTELIAIGLMEVFVINFKLSMTMAFAATLPIVVREVWLFVSPALYEHERRVAKPVTIASIFMFYLGISFGFFVIVPAFLSGSLDWASQYANVMLTVENYFDSITNMVLIFGIIFEVPVVITLLGAAGMIESTSISKNRKFVLLGAFIIGALLSPPDIFSQCIVSIPLYLMCEISVFSLKIIEKNRRAAEAAALIAESAPASPAPEASPPKNSTDESGTSHF